MIVRVGAFVVTVGLLAGCSAADDGGRDYNPAHQPRYVVPEVSPGGPGPTPTWPGSGTGLGLPGIGQAAPSEPDHVVRGGNVAAAGGKPAAFSLVHSADVVRVRVGDLGTDLFEVSTPAGSKVVPKVDVNGATVVAGLRDTGLTGPALITVVLSDDVRWTVRLAGGASDQGVDLRGGPGGDVDFSAGTSRAEVSLPAGRGTQRVALGGGASRLLVNLTGSAPVRVATKSGAGEVTVDGQTRTGVAGGSVYTPPGWETATDRFDIDATSGVSSVTVARN
ncbi:hypothetical protein [Actinoplanes nipponensis]|uniref:hypothetical protein n=1 Tax=Actinoplanes nipponensis TaxID=135950 RepID=UPI001941C4EE|nr:hypothetical protein [Actinoplanes nipponensis]